MDEHGYPEATVDGFTLGMFVSYDDCGDAWVRAPDGGVGRLIWETGEPIYFLESIPPDPAGRWGTFAVQQPLAMTTDEEAATYLRALLPELRARWEVRRNMRNQNLPDSAEAALQGARPGLSNAPLRVRCSVAS